MQPEAPVAQKPGEILAFFVRRDTKCGECGIELFSGSMLTLDKERGALCLSCADLDHLEFLASGDAAVTRRATKHSKLRAVVLQWSRSRARPSVCRTVCSGDSTRVSKMSDSGGESNRRTRLSET